MIECSRIRFSTHAVKAMVNREIQVNDVLQIVFFGEIIAAYPDDKPYPSFLMLGIMNGRPVHIVLAQSSEDGECIIVTCYEPDPLLWDSTFKQKIK